jgi:Sec-independent protein translocase protein TatA
MAVLAFLNLGLPEMLMIGVALLLLFGPGFARAIGRLGGTALSVKREIDGAKTGFRKRITQELDSALRTPKKPEDKPAEEKPPNQSDQGLRNARES